MWPSAVDYGANLIASTRGVWYGYSANGTTWTYTQVETYSDPNGWKNTDDPTIRVDSNNRPHIVFDYDDVNNGPAATRSATAGLMALPGRAAARRAMSMCRQVMRAMK